MSLAVHVAQRPLSGAALLRSRAPDPAGSGSAIAAEGGAGRSVALVPGAGEGGAPVASACPWLTPSARQGCPAQNAAAASGGVDPALEAVLDEVQGNLASLARDPETFHAALTQAFGERYDRAEAESIRRLTLAGDFSWMPEVRVVDRATLQDTSGARGAGTALGAYDSAGDVIYLGRELVEGDRGKAAAILTEEVGHGLDARLNTSDAAGDEGDIFARSVAGEEISAEELTALRAENDSGTIVVDGKEIEVEYGLWSKIKRGVRSVGRAISGGVRAIGDAVSSVGKAFDRHVIQPVRRAAEGAVDIVENTVGTVVDIGTSVWRGGREAVGRLLRGDLGGAWNAITRAGGEVVDHAVGWVLETGAMVGHEVASLIDGVTGLSETRGLNASEVAYLRTIYGDSVDYGAIRIHSGGMKSWFGGMDPHAVGNDIYLPEGYFEADGSLTEGGLELLSHEVAHSWQFQNGGAQYLSEAILSYIDDRPAAYDWERALDEALPFDDMTPDQQAEFARLIGMAIALDPKGVLTVKRLEEVMQADARDPSLTLDAADFSYIEGIRDRLAAGLA